jgi:hypothetical protein
MPAGDVVDASGNRGRDTGEGKCAGDASNLREIEAVLNAGSCAMTWRKKLSDELSVRT